MRRLIRVAYCVENLGVSGGTESNAVRTMENIDRTRVDPVVVAIGPDGPMRARYERAGYTVHRFRTGPLWHPKTYTQVVRLARFFRDRQIEVVHANDVYTNWVCTLAGRLARVPCVLASKRWTTEQDRFRHLTRLSFRMADAVLGNSELIARSAHEVDGARADRLVVVPNFIELSAFERLPAAEVVAWRTQLGIDPSAVVFGCVQRLRVEKEHARVIRAFASLRLPSACQLVLVGDGPEEERLRVQVASLPPAIKDRVRLVGHLPSRPSPHQLFDVSILPARSEGFPNSMLEAMAMGRAVISTDVGGVRDALEDGESGLLVPPSDEAAMSAAMQRLLSDHLLRASLGTAALVRARGTYASDRVLPRLVDVYVQLLGRVGQ
jgi:glycosyltransferase involved in cell wall biosynthesis